MCSRSNSKLVRKLIEFKWGPILQKYKVGMSIQCPFHPHRDIFRLENEAKRCSHQRMWICRICGKQFIHENHFENHYDHKHGRFENIVEDAVCLSDFCDIMRCDVFLPHELKLKESALPLSTSIEARQTPISLFSSHEIDRTTSDSMKKKRQSTHFQENEFTLLNNWLGHYDVCSNSKIRFVDNKKDIFFNNKNTERNLKSRCGENLFHVFNQDVDSMNEVLAQERKLECTQEVLSTLKEQCELLTRTCITESLLHLSDTDFIQMEEELNQAVCSYLTCDRYWKDKVANRFLVPWGSIILGAIFLSLSVCFCYYIVWIFYESKNVTIRNQSDHISFDYYINNLAVNKTPGEKETAPTIKNASPIYKERISNELSSVHHNEHYIFVTYPIDMKERFLKISN